MYKLYITGILKYATRVKNKKNKDIKHAPFFLKKAHAVNSYVN